MEFILDLKIKNSVLFWFGMINLISAILFIYLSFIRPIEFAGTNAWHKPIKFALSTWILVWSVAWYSGYIPKSLDVSVVNWIVVITLAFEVYYIAWQASKGQASHYNISNAAYSLLFSLMALAASIASLAIGYIGLKFFTVDIKDIPSHYLWAIRFGFILFVVFSFQGFLMGGRMAHTVGGADGSPGIPFFNWSLTYGDLRMAHFFGMHALQVLPLLSFYLLKSSKLTWVGIGCYLLLAGFLLIQALRGQSIF